jgi:hypothetical protein
MMAHNNKYDVELNDVTGLGEEPGDRISEAPVIHTDPRGNTHKLDVCIPWLTEIWSIGIPNPSNSATSTFQL